MRATRITVAALAATALLALPGAAQGAPRAATVADRTPSGDFDGDGYDDLAVGAPYEGVGDVPGGGNVTVGYGGPDGPGSGGSEVVRQGLAGVPGAAEEWDNFGWASVAGDFDGDGYDDLAVGAPGESVGSRYNAGNVTVVRGSAAGLTGRGALVLRQGLAPVGQVAERFDRFGAALAAADLDGDGYDDLAVGSPSEGIDGARWAGMVTVLFGGPDGPGARVTTVREGAGGVPGTPGAGEDFGAALAAGDVDGDGFADLAIGVPSEWPDGIVVLVPGSRGGLAERDATVLDPEDLCECTTGTMWFGKALAAGDLDGDGYADLAIGSPIWHAPPPAYGAGNVTVVFGGAAGPGRSLVLDQSTFGLAPEEFDEFGQALAIGPLDGDGADELLVAAPGEDVGDVESAGLVLRVRGGAGFPGAATVWHQGNLVGTAEQDDRFGESVTVGDYSGDGVGDAAIGAPGETVGDVPAAGNVTVVDTTGGASALNQGTLGAVVEPYEAFGRAVA